MKKLCLVIISTIIVFVSHSAYATTYISLHGVDTGATGNISEMYYNFSSNFRVLIPPGTTYFSLSMICDGAAYVTTVARFGQAPSDYLPLPSYSSPTAKTLDQARTGNIISSSSDGILNIALQYFYPQPLAESQAGWLYVDIVGSGVRHVDYNLSVNASVYTEWYNRSKGNTDCSCAMMGQCAMCPAGGGTCTSPVTANFSASSTTITAGASVSFTNTTSGSASYSWSFGDGSSYTGGTPSAHTYSNVGLYNVTLTATPTDTNCSVSTKTQTITVTSTGFHGYIKGKAPADSAIVTDAGASAVADQNGDFTLVQRSGTSMVSFWVPGYKTLQNARVEVPEGGETTVGIPELHRCESPPNAQIISLPSPITISNNESVNFKGDASGGAGEAYEYFWYFGGGTPNSRQKVPGDVVFKKSDSIKVFSVVLYVKDAEGCVNKSQTVRVNYIQPDPIYGDDSLALNIPCAEYQGARYKFTLNYSAMSDDPSGFYWKMDTSTFGAVTDTEMGCIPVGNDLKINIGSAMYHGTAYSFTLNYNTPIASDPLGLYWKMDLSTLKNP